MIFMLDDNENLVQVNLSVKDEEGLFIFLTQLTDSNFLGKDGNYDIVSSKKKSSFGNLVYFGNHKKDNMLVKNHRVSFEPQEYYGRELEWLFEYKQDIIKCMNLNSVLLFFNLLDEGSVYFCDELASEFLNAGIFKRQPLDVVWKNFISNLTDEDGRRDIDNFRYALKNGLIGTSIERIWTKAELQQFGILHKYNLDWKEIIAVTDMFNINSSLTKNRVPE